MKLPTQIVTRHKVRDAAICSLYAREIPVIQIADRFKISQRHVNRILYLNRHVQKLDAEWEKIKRYHQLSRSFNNAGETKKDPLDILEAMRKEIEGDKPLVDNSTHITQIIYTRKKSDTDNRDQLRSAELSGRDSRR